ncbi:MAG TPA: maleylpyruvate isomerase N-terminal domain-containing protein [Bryobacteraceae bacterium]|nr:maleylpyruvate isomerase N-terminal domain-containing protein [Bryobacteraceae bacterium]
MSNRSYVEENDVSRLELAGLCAGLDDRSFGLRCGSGWTVSALLCHLAFWDQRVSSLLGQWQSGPLAPARLDAQQVDSINAAVKSVAARCRDPRL